MKLLVISYLFPPIWEAQSIRWYYITKTLNKLGVEVEVVTVNVPNALFPIKGIRIHRIYPGPFEYVLFKYKKNKSLDFTNKSSRVRNGLFYKVFKKSYRIVRQIFNYLLLGEVRNEWFLPFLYFYYSFLKKKIEKGNYDFIICAHEPLVDIIIALFLKSMHPYIRLIVDIADPLNADYYPSILKPFLLKLEKSVLRKSSLVLVTNEEIKNFYIERYKIREETLHIYTQGFEENLFKSIPSPSYPEGEIKLFYAGSFYPFRNPREFFNALRKVEGFKFFYAGRNEEYIPKDLIEKGKVIYLGVLSHSEVLKFLMNMDVLIYFSNKQKLQIPGKLFEYFGAKKPILCITPNENDLPAQLIRKFNVGLVVKNKENEIIKSLNILKNRDIWNTFKFGNELLEFSWENQTQKLYNRLKMLL